MLLSVDSNNIVETVWRKKFYEARKSDLKHDDYQIMVAEINRIVDAKLTSKENFLVSSFIPGKDWSGTAWHPIYEDACYGDQEHAAMFFGLLVCQVLIDREETWCFLKQDDAASMKYFLKIEKKKQTETIVPKATVNDLMNKFS